MLLSELATEYVTQRGASGLFIAPEQVLDCAVQAARFYAGWASLDDATAVSLAAISGATDITASEWALIGPLFRLYAEREAAVVLENSRGLGVDVPGRASSEIASEIQAAEAAMPMLAFSEDCYTIGIPVVTP